ncbi:MAG: type IIA DNA topoisomerase subunit B [Clostridiales bacterium]|nr:type IIA DNA topoisomerase subunit B [Clostridiales bacterium]
MEREYTAKDIVVMKGLEGVRHRPGMYIGTTSVRGLHHLLWEITDNCVDEAINGYADKIEIVLNADGSVTVTDNGRGMPIDKHPELKIPAVEVIFTVLHAGGKFNYSSYSYSGGLHGVGASVVNALSRWLEVEIYRDGNIYKERFESNYNKKTKKIDSGVPVAPLTVVGQTKRKGTSVTFMPDDRVFDTVEFNYDTIAMRMRETAYLNSGLTITLKDMRTRPAREDEFCFMGGIRDYVSFFNNDKKALFSDIIYISGEYNAIKVEAAFQYNDGYSENIFSYVNNIATTDGGMHETGFKTALTKVINEFSRRFGVLKDKDDNFSGEDVREGLTAVLSVKMRDIQFEGQTKTRLGNSEARVATEMVITEEFTKYLNDRKNDNVAKAITSKAVEASHARLAAKKAKTEARKKTGGLENAPLIGKLAACTGRDKSRNELFIVEGNSAGGSAKQGRNREYQAILSLRGKPLNVEKTRLAAVEGNEEYRTIIAALGTGIAQDFDISKLNYDKVIILSDADQDGAHIRAILLTFFYRYMRDLIKDGHIYIGLSPLYKISKGGKDEYAYTDEELLEVTKRLEKGYTLQRYKGLGEMNPEQLWATTMNPANRKLLKVDIEDAKNAEYLITVLMGDKADKRYDYIIQNANFNKKDAYEDIVR